LHGSDSADNVLIFTKDVYRIRILNAFWKAYFTHLHFRVFRSDGNNKTIIPFTIVGVDSSVMATPETNITDITLAAA
jgi:hypothetical protein